MMKRMLSVLFALGFIVSCLMVFVEVDVVSGEAISYTEDFDGMEDILNGDSVETDFFYSYLYNPSLYRSQFKVTNTFSYSGSKSFYIKSSGCNNGKFNFTTDWNESITHINFWIYSNVISNDVCYFKFMDNNSVQSFYFGYYYNSGGKYRLCAGVTDEYSIVEDVWYYIDIYTTPDKAIYVGIYNSSMVLLDTLVSYANVGTYPWTLSQILFQGGGNDAQSCYIDDFKVIYDDYAGESETDNDIYVSFKDGTNDNVIITGIDTDFVGAVVQGTKEFFVSSDLWSGYYSFPFNYVVSVNTISDSWVDGSYHYLNVSCRDGLTGDYLFGDVSYNFQWYSGRNYDIIFYEQGYGDYINEWTSSDSGLIFGIRTDKYVYDYGEQVRVQYKLPSYYDLMDSGIGVSGLWVAVKDIDAVFWNLGSLSDWHSGSVSAYSIKDDSFMYGDWFDAGAFTTKDTEDGYDRLEVRIGKFGIFGILANSYAHVFIDVYDDETGFVPSGNITDITPDEPTIGQNIKFTYNGNNNGRFKIIFLGSGNVVYNSTFLKPIGFGNVTVNLADVGQYVIYEDVFADTSYQNVDYMSFYVNGSGSDFEDWGKNNEYLYVMDDHLIAAYDTLTVFYKTLVNDTNVDFISPKGAKAPFSTSVDNLSGNSLSIPLPYWVGIGEWNVTMNTSNGVIYDTFHVVAEENNYAEFEKNSYSLNESVSFYIRHNKKVRVVLVHDGNSYGTDLFFDNTTLPEGIYRIENTKVFTEGVWELQLWEANNRLAIKLLSSDTATFMYYFPIPNQGDGIVDFGSWNWLAGFVIFGIVLGAGVLITSRMKFRSDKASSMLVGIFGFSGLAISTVLNLFPLWLPFLIGLFIVAVLFLLIRKG